MIRNRLGKIVATVGPASSSPEMLEKIFLAGVDVFRLNFSHGTHEDHAAVFNCIRGLSKKYKYYPCIMADLQGPKLRVGLLRDKKVEIKTGDIFNLDLDPTPGDETRINLPHPEIFAALKEGSILLVDDGKVRLEVITCDGKSASTRVIVGGYVSNTKGVNVPDVILPIPSLPEKDLRDLEFALGLGADWVALSFVQTEKDLIDARKIIGDRAKIVSKLEKPSAIHNLDSVVKASDGIMVARGDLAVETSAESVPIMQRDIIEACHRLGKPVIVATQMLESMIDLPTPTRAEASDVATAVYCGGDSTMLSAECAAGKYPVGSVEMMDRIITSIESHSSWGRHMEVRMPQIHYTTSDAFASGAYDISKYLQASVIAVYTDSLDTLIRISRLRPKARILALTQCVELATRAGMLWGVQSVVVPKDGKAQMLKAREAIAELKLLESNEKFVLYIDGDTPEVTFGIV